jgi:hypothetical protein
VLQALLAQAPENPYWNPTTITFYGVVIAALLAGPAAIMLQGRIRAQEAEAAARRKREDEEAKAARQREAKDAEESTENVAWLRGQVGRLQQRVDGAERREADWDSPAGGGAGEREDHGAATGRGLPVAAGT